MGLSAPVSPATRITALLLAGTLLGCGQDGTDTPEDTAGPTPPGTDPAPLAEDTPPREPPTGEVLLAGPPEGWVETGALQTPALRMAEYGPGDETGDRLERLTFEAQTGKPLPDPIEFVLAVSRDLESRCTHFEDINISSGEENGYPTSVRLMICPEFKDSPHGQVVMAKAIQGNEEFYVITRRLRVPPMKDQGQPLTAQEMAEWSTHLKGVRVCDTRNEASHPCPESVAESAS